jgi:hypothetical protein
MRTNTFQPGEAITLSDGTRVLLLSEFRVVFGANLSSEEPPIGDIASEAIADAVIRNRHPKAEIEPWDLARRYDVSPSHGWLSTPFYAGPDKGFAGYLEWRYEQVTSAEVLSCSGAAN